MRIGIVIGSVREGRKGAAVGRWVEEVARAHGADVQVLDLKEFDLPLLTSATVPASAQRRYDSPQVQRWSEAVDACGAYVFVTPEYNHGVPGAFKNAVDSIYPEWADKRIGFVSYGADKGVRAVEQWRQIVANLHLHDIRTQVSFSTFEHFSEDGELTPQDRHAETLRELLDALQAH